MPPDSPPILGPKFPPGVAGQGASKRLASVSINVFWLNLVTPFSISWIPAHPVKNDSSPRSTVVKYMCFLSKTHTTRIGGTCWSTLSFASCLTSREPGINNSAAPVGSRSRRARCGNTQTVLCHLYSYRKSQTYRKHLRVLMLHQLTPLESVLLAEVSVKAWPDLLLCDAWSWVHQQQLLVSWLVLFVEGAVVICC